MELNIKNGISGGPNGEEACEGHGFDPEQCLAVGCCQFDESNGLCWSAVGSEPCETTTDPTGTTGMTDMTGMMEWMGMMVSI